MKTYMKTMDSKTLERLLRCGLVVLVVWLAVMVISAGAQSFQLSGKASTAIREYERIRTEAAEPREESRDQIQKLSRNNLFVAAPGQSPLPQSLAIMGNSVLIGEQWYTEGQTVQGYEIVKIGPDFVTVMLDGKEQRFSPFDVEVNYGQAARSTTERGGRSGREGREGDRGMRGGRGGMQPPVFGADAAAPGMRPGGFGGNMMGGNIMEMRNRIESMTPEQRQETFERFRNASPEERERMRDEFMRGRE